MCSLVFRTQQTIMVSSPYFPGSMLPVLFADFWPLWGFLLMAYNGSLLLRIALGWLEPPHLEMPWIHTSLPCAGAAGVIMAGLKAGQTPRYNSCSRALCGAEFTSLKISFLLSFCLISILLSYSLTDVFCEHSLNKSLGHKSLSQSLHSGNPSSPGSPQADSKIL